MASPNRGEVTAQVRLFVGKYLQKNGEFPGSKAVFEALPHLQGRRNAVYKAVQELRGKYKAGTLPALVEVGSDDVPEFPDTWEGMKSRIRWYVERLDALVARSGGADVPVKELVDLAKLRRDVEKWIQEDQGAKGAVATARAPMAAIVMRASKIEKELKRRSA